MSGLVSGTVRGQGGGHRGGVTPCPLSGCRPEKEKTVRAIRMELDRDKYVQVGEILRYLETDRYLDKAESANYLGVGLRTFEGWMNQIPRYRPGGKVLFKKSELDEFMKRHEERPSDVDLERIADDAVASILR
jgi:excisionase family DNA binding protein